MANNLKKTLQSTLLSVLFIALAGSMPAVADENFPGQEPDRQTLRTQEKADSLFEKGEYDRAMFIYREELAPRGDKYAQYMIGFMYLTGKGVPQDVAQASAWYRLAAERGQDVFVGARDELLAVFDENSRPFSDQAYRELRRELSDVALLSELIRADLQIFRRELLSRPELMRNFQEGTGGSGRARSRRVEPIVERLRERVDFLIDLSMAEDFDPAVEQKGVDLLEAEVKMEIERFESR
jgi:TPR repeat protein